MNLDYLSDTARFIIIHEFNHIVHEALNRDNEMYINTNNTCYSEEAYRYCISSYTNYINK